MRLFPLVVATILFGCGAANAQSPMTSGGIGATSPLGVPGSSASSRSNSPTGIPLGATEIDPGGLSPAPLSNCSTSGFTANSGTSSGMIGSSASGMGSTSGVGTTSTMGSTFDGGGFGSTTTSVCASPGASVNTATSTGTASPLSTMGTNSNFTLNGGAIPLGSTEIDSAGVSPLITVPMTNSLMPSCAGATTSSSGAVIGSTALGTIPPGC
jgi:hypothetical protein